MRDPKRIDRILSKLATYWKMNPHLRLGQVVSDLCAYAGQNKGIPKGPVFYLEDDELEKAIMYELGWEDKQ